MLVKKNNKHGEKTLFQNSYTTFKKISWGLKHALRGLQLFEPGNIVNLTIINNCLAWI